MKLLNLPSCSHYRQITITLVSAVLLVVALCMCVHMYLCVHTRVHACVFVCVFVFVCVCVHRVWRIYVRNLPSVCPSKFPFSIPFFLEAKKGKKESLLNRQKNRFLPSVY